MSLEQTELEKTEKHHMEPDSPNFWTENRAAFSFVLTGLLGVARFFFEYRKRRHEPLSIVKATPPEESFLARMTQLEKDQNRLEKRQDEFEHRTRTDIRNANEDRRRMHQENKEDTQNILEQLGQQREVLDKILLQSLEK